MPSAGSSFRRGSTYHSAAVPVQSRTRRGPGRVETVLVTASTIVLVLVAGMMISTLLLSTDASFSTADARTRPMMSVSPASGAPGAAVMVYGKGYPSGTAQLLWDGSADGMPAAVTDRHGAFELQLVVPLRAAVGTHMLSVASGATRVT